MAKKPHEKINELLQKAEKVKDGYAEGKAKALEEVKELKEELASMSEQVKEFHKAYILNQITADSYNAEKKVLEVLAEKVKDAEAKVSLIDNYEREDLQKVFFEIQEIEMDYRKQRYEARAVMYQKAQELKKQYLKELREASREYRMVHSPIYYTGELEVYAGLKKINYADGSGEFHATLIGDSYSGTKPATVTREELEKVYYNR